MEFTCKDCRFFNNKPEWLEQNFKGMSVFSSGYAAVKADDGICSKKEIYLTPLKAQYCPDFEQDKDSR